VHKGTESEAYVREQLSENGWHGNVIVVSNEDNAHYDAMAASDVGMLYDG